MKAKIIVFSKEDFNFVDNKTINFLLPKLYKKNIDANNIEFISKNKPDLHVFSGDGYDYCIILADENVYEFAKQRLANFLDKRIVENQFAINYANSYSNKTGIKLSKLDKQHASMPESSRAIINTISFLFGFILNENNVTYFFLPNKLIELESMFNDSVIKYIDTEEKRKQYSESLKTFCLNSDKI